MCASSQGFFIFPSDPAVQEDPDKIESPVAVSKRGLHTNPGLWARNTSLNEDLGQIEYVFSDKTGTLTANDMQLRMLSLGGVEYGRMDLQLEARPDIVGTDALRVRPSYVAWSGFDVAAC